MDIKIYREKFLKEVEALGAKYIGAIDIFSDPLAGDKIDAINEILNKIRAGNVAKITTSELKQSFGEIAKSQTIRQVLKTKSLTIKDTGAYTLIRKIQHLQNLWLKIEMIDNVDDQVLDDTIEILRHPPTDEVEKTKEFNLFVQHSYVIWELGDSSNGENEVSEIITEQKYLIDQYHQKLSEIDQNLVNRAKDEENNLNELGF